MLKQQAIFLDRDGTIIEDTGYIRTPEEIVVYPYTLEALRILQEHFLLFIVTSQSGVAKGFITADEANNVNRYCVDYLRAHGIKIEEVFCCPHANEDNCECKKPKPYFLNKAALLYDLDLSRCFIIGDHPSDVQCGVNAGATPVYVLSGHGRKHRNELLSDTKISENLLEATMFIKSTIQ